MATKYTPPAGKTRTEQALEAYADQTYEGIFIGSLTGNADTATALKQAFTVTVAGDASGNFSTAGNSTTLTLDVQHSDTASEANHAKTADTVTKANTASSADFATYATHAQSADNSVNAENATRAETSDYALNAGQAANANEAQHALNADMAANAKHAAEAVTADEAKVALALKNPENPVDYARYADKAGLSTMTQYDCEGYSIVDNYAKKSDVVLKADAFTRQEADVLYARRGALLKTATVIGKAIGTGVVEGTDLLINITDVVQGEAASFYDALVWLSTPDLPATPDTTKIYITNDGALWLYSQDSSTWEQIKGTIPDTLSAALQEALEKLTGVVDLTTDQTINGHKTFEDIPVIPIASLRDDPDRYAASLHNVRDARDRLKYAISELQAEIQTRLNLINARLDAQQRGDVLLAYIDYTIPANQVQMVVGTTYIGYLTEDGKFIEIDPATKEQKDPSLVPYFERHFYKTSDGYVTWRDFKMDSVTFGEYARLDGADFTGAVTVPSKARPLETVGVEVLNAHDIRLIVDDLIDQALEAEDLAQYMPRTGGAFTGPITVPDYALPSEAPDGAVLNKKNVKALIDENSFSIVRLDSAPPDDTDLEPKVIYAVPSSTVNAFRGEVHSINVLEDSVGLPAEVSPGEMAAFVATNLLAD